MVRIVAAGVVGAAMAIAAGGTSAQTRESSGQQPPLAAQAARSGQEARYQIFVMEGVLERAVEHGARLLGQQMQAVLPGAVVVAGTARARGFKLDGYGVFFDVEVPALRRTLAWSFRVLDQGDSALVAAVAALRRHLQTLSDVRARQEVEQALKRIEAQLRPGPSGPRGAETVSAQVLSGSGAPAVARRPVLEDPARAYEAEVRNGLIDAMLDHSEPIGLGPTEWLTVAAKANDDARRLGAEEPSDLRTITLRIRSADLAAFRAGRLTREEAKNRVEVNEF